MVTISYIDADNYVSLPQYVVMLCVTFHAIIDTMPRRNFCARFSNLARGNAVARLTPAIAIDVGNYAKTYR